MNTLVYNALVRFLAKFWVNFIRFILFKKIKDKYLLAVDCLISRIILMI